MHSLDPHNRQLKSSEQSKVMNRLTVFSLPCALVVWLLALQVVKVNAATSQVLLTYGNGSVVSNVEVTIIYYNSTSQDQADIFGYYTSLVVSTYMNIFSEYGTSTQIIGSGKVVGTYLETNNIKTNLSDLVDVRPYLRSLVLAGTLNPNANSYVAIHYPTGVTISTSDLGTSCQQFGGYHSAVYVGDISPNVQYMYYGVLPYCGTTALDMAPAISHELGETVTDPLGNTGWYHASTGQEIGDLCNGMNGMVDDPLNPGNSLTIQKLWSNVQQKCISSRSSPLPPPASYSSTSSKKIYDATLSSRPVSIQSVEITPIFYGMNVSFKANLTDFYKFLVTSPYIGALSEFDSSTQHFALGTSKAAHFETSNLLTSLSVESTFPSYLRGLVKSGAIKPNANSFYPIHLAPGITGTYQSYSTCVDFCSLYGWTSISDLTSSASTLYYAIIPDQTGPCRNVCNMSPDPLRETTASASAMLLEVLTYAWSVASVGSVTDVCMGQYFPLRNGAGDVWTVRRYWSNKYQQCIAGAPTTSSSTSISATSSLSPSAIGSPSASLPPGVTISSTASLFVPSSASLPPGVTISSTASLFVSSISSMFPPVPESSSASLSPTVTMFSTGSQSFSSMSPVETPSSTTTMSPPVNSSPDVKASPDLSGSPTAIISSMVITSTTTRLSVLPTSTVLAAPRPSSVPVATRSTATTTIKPAARPTLSVSSRSSSTTKPVRPSTKSTIKTTVKPAPPATHTTTVAAVKGKSSVKTVKTTKATVKAIPQIQKAQTTTSSTKKNGN